MIRPNIVTVYNSPNCGSFLQGFALGEALCRMTGCAPRYVETGARSPAIKTRTALRESWEFRDPSRYFFAKKRAESYFSAVRDYVVADPMDGFSDNDLLVFGSDEIWNLERANIAAFPSFWGSGLSGGGLRVSYAPSTNGADLNKAPCAEDFKNGLGSLDALSVRDHVSLRSVQELSSRDVELVCDPTLLLDTDYYRSLQVDPSLADFILVYTYGANLSKADIADIRSFARSRGLKLVSIVTSLSWCDVSIPAGPFEFLGLMDKADYVVTDTFHGTVFSSIYHKKYASYARANTKIVEFMRDFSVEDHIAGDGRSLADVLACEASFTAFDAQWARMREKSLAYLKCAVRRCEEKSGDHDSRQPIKIERGVDLASMTTFRMGGKVARLWEPKRGDDLHALPKGMGGYRVLSGGSNLLVSERTFTDVVSMKCFDESIEGFGDGEYRVGASVRIQKLITSVNSDGYGGIEALISVPGMVGGLVCMNASVPSASTCISDYLVSVEAFDGESVVEIPKEECGFEYRESRFQDGNMLILGARFRFPSQSHEESTAKIDARRKYVRDVQDKSAPNFGSVFCRSSGKAMRLIRRKGLAVGGIAFSGKTGNWLLNKGGSFAEALAVIKKAIALNKMLGKKAKLEVRVWR